MRKLAAQKQQDSKLLLIVLILVLVVLGGGFIIGSLTRKEKEEVVPPTAEVEEVAEIPPNVSKGSVEETSGGFEIDRGGLRAFPRDFPKYPHAKVSSSWDPRSDLPFEGVTVAWESSDSPSDIISYFETELGEAGWTTDSSLGSPATLSFEKGSTKGYIWCGPEGDGSVFTITVASK